MKCRALVFDFDGVIVESTDIKTTAFARLFPDHQEEVVAHHLANVGISRYEKFKYIYANIMGLPLSEDQMKLLDRQFAELILEQVLRCPFVPGIPEFLAAQFELRPLFIASGVPQDELAMILETRQLKPFFQGAYGSPARKSDLLRQIQTATSLKPEEIVFIGDSTQDHQAALPTGVRFVGRVREGRPNPFETSVPTISDFIEFDVDAIH